MKVVVTGGAGYLGTTLVPCLLEQGHHVTVFDSLKHGIAPMLPFFKRDNFAFEHGDIRSVRELSVACREAETLIHLAAVSGYPACKQDPEEARSTNVEGTRVVAKVAKRQCPVVFASTSSCYGAVEGLLCTEETPLRPVSLYAKTKVECEQILLDQCNAIVYRIATAYGVSPRMRLDLLINDFVHRALHERQLSIYQGHFRRSFIHVDDVARGFEFAIERFDDMAGQVWNLGDEGQNFSKMEIGKLIASYVPAVRIDECHEGEDADQRNYAVSYARVLAMGYRAQVPLKDGIARLVSALRWAERNEFS